MISSAAIMAPVIYLLVLGVGAVAFKDHVPVEGKTFTRDDNHCQRAYKKSELKNNSTHTQRINAYLECVDKI